MTTAVRNPLKGLTERQLALVDVMRENPDLRLWAKAEMRYAPQGAFRRVEPDGQLTERDTYSLERKVSHAKGWGARRRHIGRMIEALRIAGLLDEVSRVEKKVPTYNGGEYTTYEATYALKAEVGGTLLEDARKIEGERIAQARAREQAWEDAKQPLDDKARDKYHAQRTLVQSWKKMLDRTPEEITEVPVDDDTDTRVERRLGAMYRVYRAYGREIDQLSDELAALAAQHNGRKVVRYEWAGSW